MMKKIYKTLIFILALNLSSANISAQQNSGYTNIAGCGSNYNFIDLNQCNNNTRLDQVYCDLYGKNCYINGHQGVVKFTCEGKEVKCENPHTETAFGYTQQIATNQCNKTIQIDVFSKNCRPDDGDPNTNPDPWICNNSNLLDYIVYYTGPCPTSTPTKTPSNTPTPTHTPTHTPTNTPTATPSPTVPPPLTNTPSPSPTGTLVPTKTPSPTATPTPTTTINKGICKNLEILEGNNEKVPAKVKFRATAEDKDGKIKKFKFYYGDGNNKTINRNHDDYRETNPDEFIAETEHVYDSSGTFYAIVHVNDSHGNTIKDEDCEVTVNVESSDLESHKSDCSDLYIEADHGAVAPSHVKFRVTGFDNKGDIKKYRITINDGSEMESEDNKFEKEFTQAGTYKIKAFIKDSEGNWKGGEDNCERNLYINTETFEEQPDTGTPTLFTVAGIFSLITGAVGISQDTKSKLKN